MTTPTRLIAMACNRKVALIFALSATAACGDFEIQNQDVPSINALEQAPTPSVIAAASQGLLNGVRQMVVGFQSSIYNNSHYGREGYYIDVAQTRLTAFDDVLTPSDGLTWSTVYQYVRLGNTIRHALDVVTGMSDPQKEATRGFVKTVEAYLLHTQLRNQWTFGIAIDTDHPRSDPVPPIADTGAVFTYLVNRLDEAKTHLLAGGAAFPFSLGNGFTGFNTPANFLKVNRALKARVLIERGDPTGALAALAESFVDPAAAMALGAYNNFSTGSGDQTNPYFDVNGFSFVADSFLPYEAQTQPGGAPDARVTSKMALIRNAAGTVIYRTHTRVTSDLRWSVYATALSPIPLIKNEELLLIRAEALWRTGNTAGAMADLNTVRTVSGGLAAIGAFPGDLPFENELLYNRRYSLLFEYGHRWVDLRRFTGGGFTDSYGRLKDPTQLHGPRGAGDLIFDKIPLPQADCDARPAPKPAGCSQVSGVGTTS